MNLFPIVLLALVVPVSAATISWSSVPYVNGGVNKSEMGIDQFDQSSDQFLAVNLGAEGAQTLVQSVDPNIIFSASDPKFSILPGAVPANDMSLLSPAGTFHADLGGNNNISGSAAHSNVGAGETGPVSFRLSSLIPGRTYIIQGLLMDDNTFITDVYFDGNYLTSFGAQGQESGTDGVLAIGSFIADGNTQDFVIQTTDALFNPTGALLNAIHVQSRPVPEPSVILLGGLALSGVGLRRRRVAGE
ncbi:MAG: PEP-CTERM sorting domain-containing protein [Verrucomicrobia bacterium]|nr:PEP-CTERM sorting domain-containing protein [Verrucomicrobiota bacterium]